MKAVQEFISIREAAEFAGVHPDTIRRKIASGDLEARRLGTRIIRVDRAQVEFLLRPIPTANSAA